MAQATAPFHRHAGRLAVGRDRNALAAAAARDRVVAGRPGGWRALVLRGRMTPAPARTAQDVLPRGESPPARDAPGSRATSAHRAHAATRLAVKPGRESTRRRAAGATGTRHGCLRRPDAPRRRR